MIDKYLWYFCIRHLLTCEGFCRGQQKAYALLEKAEMRRRAVVISFLKQREKLKKLQLEFTLAGFGLSVLGLYESYKSSISFDHAGVVVVDILARVHDTNSNVGELKSDVSIPFGQLQSAFDVFHCRMAELDASVTLANARREAEYKKILSSVGRPDIRYSRPDIRYSRPDAIMKKKFGFLD